MGCGVALGLEWSDDPDSSELAQNLDAVAQEIVSHALSRQRPSADLAKAWHGLMLGGIDVPSDAYRGGIRGESHPHLRTCNVQVNGVVAVYAPMVALLNQLYAAL